MFAFITKKKKVWCFVGTRVQCLWKPEEGIASPETQGVCELSKVGLGKEAYLYSLEYIPLTAKLLSHLSRSSFFFLLKGVCVFVGM